MKNYTNIILNALPDREMEIVGTLIAEKMSAMRLRALAKMKESVEIDGFRTGNAPDALVAAKVGEMRLLEEAAEMALSEEYPHILEEYSIAAIGRPQISITKIGVGAPMEFKIKTALEPDVKLGDYKKAASSKQRVAGEKTDATDQEINEVVKNIQRNIAHEKIHREGNLEVGSHDHPEIKDEDLPVVDDAFVKQLGDFKNVEDFKAKIKEGIIHEKELKEKDKRRVEILEKIIESSKIELPNIIIEGEQEKMLAQFKDDVARSGIPFEDYLKHIKKTEEDLKKEWRETAVKRAKSQIILNTIAKEENISAPEEEVKKEMDTILAVHKGADRFRVRMYVETFLTNELVFQFLEKQK